MDNEKILMTLDEVQRIARELEAERQRQMELGNKKPKIVYPSAVMNYVHDMFVVQKMKLDLVHTHTSIPKRILSYWLDRWTIPVDIGSKKLRDKSQRLNPNRLPPAFRYVRALRGTRRTGLEQEKTFKDIVPIDQKYLYTFHGDLTLDEMEVIRQLNQKLPEERLRIQINDMTLREMRLRKELQRIQESVDEDGMVIDTITRREGYFENGDIDVTETRKVRFNTKMKEVNDAINVIVAQKLKFEQAVAIIEREKALSGADYIDVETSATKSLEALSEAELLLIAGEVVVEDIGNE